jgi:hypothetical protein
MAGSGGEDTWQLVPAQAGDYPAGAWAPGESRDYHVGIRVNAANVGQEVLAARVSLLASSPEGQQVLAQGLIRATWTEDETQSTRINRRVAHYTGQAELAQAIQEGLEASRRGDEELATARLGRAVALAHQAGNEDTSRLLSKVVDVMDEKTGTVQLRKKVEAADEMTLPPFPGHLDHPPVSRNGLLRVCGCFWKEKWSQCRGRTRRSSGKGRWTWSARAVPSPRSPGCSGSRSRACTAGGGRTWSTAG